MGSGSSSQQRLGERVLAAQEKLTCDRKMAVERATQLRTVSPETLDVMVQSIAASFHFCAPFSDATLLVAYAANPVEVERVLTKSCKQVMSAPVAKDEYRWFMVSALNRGYIFAHVRCYNLDSNTCSRRRCG